MMKYFQVKDDYIRKRKSLIYKDLLQEVMDEIKKELSSSIIREELKK